jgi:hypothetical protein
MVTGMARVARVDAPREGPTSETISSSSAMQAAASGNELEAKWLAGRGTPACCSSSSSRTPMQAAAVENHVEANRGELRSAE